MRLVSFNPYRSLGLSGVRYIKPELVFRHRDDLVAADWVLFPEYWQVNFLVYGLKKRIFPSIGTYHLGHDKIEMTRAFESVCPANVPRTLILPATEAAASQVLEEFTVPFVVKEPRNAMGRGVFLIEDQAAFRDYAHRAEMLYAQEYLPIDRDLRVVWVGDRVLAAYWRVAGDGVFHNNVARGGRIVFEEIPAAALDLVARTAAELGINHAGFDLALVAGHWYLLEFNVLFGNQALTDLGLNAGPAIADYLARLDGLHRDPEPWLPKAS